MPDPVSPGSLVTLTGASGFLAKHILRGLLEEGYAVRATLRTPARQEEVRAAVLPGLGSDAGDRLTFVTADLLREEGWEAALAGAQALIHTASPVVLSEPRDPQDLIRPAVEGTRRALGAAAAAGVTRVVVTSSVAAVIHPSSPQAQDEADWADPDEPGAMTYARSKTLAERAAWEIAEAKGLDLTVINPGWVLGPLLDTKIGASVDLILRMLERRDPMLPDFGFPIVDVRDVVLAHVRALQEPSLVGQRLIIAAESLSMPEMARVLKETYPDRKIPTRIAPRLLVRLMGLFTPEMRQIVSQLGHRQRVSNSKARQVLGADFIPADEAVRATAKDLIRLRLA